MARYSNQTNRNGQKKSNPNVHLSSRCGDRMSI